MQIIPGILASSYVQATNSFESIATTTVGSGGSTSITFNSLPTTYKHLQIRGIAKLSTVNNLRMRLNGDTGSYYQWSYSFSTGSAASAYLQSSDNAMYGSYLPVATSVFGSFIWDIYDYRNANINKYTMLLTGTDTNGGGNVAAYSGIYQFNDVTTSITINAAGGETIQEYSSFALYGIKG